MEDRLATRRCTAVAKHTGLQCARAPIPGGSVCINHGGGAPQTIAAAKARLLAMVEPVLGAFEEILAAWHGTRCHACGRPTGDPGPVIQVGRLVLDRSGLGPQMKFEVSSSPAQELADRLSGLSSAELADQAETLAKSCRDMADADAALLADRSAAPALLPEVDGRAQAKGLTINDNRWR